MATTKNINMKSYNGTDYDTLYPATQTSQVLGNWDLTKVSGLLSTAFGGTGANSLDELALNLGLNNQYAQIATGTYVGTGTYGQSNPNSLTFDFYPEVVFLDNSVLWITSWTGDSHNTFSLDDKTLSWYTTQTSYPDQYQFNVSGVKYHYCAMGLDVLTSFERLITTVGSSTITLPVTGKYYLELHGGGGGSVNNISGGGSGQVYNSIQLSAGTYNITIGKGGNSYYATDKWTTAGGSTSFGSYTVAGGLPNTNGSAPAGSVAGSGNVGGASESVDVGNRVFNAKNGGGLYPQYGGGGTSAYLEQTYQTPGTQGCVYIKYLPQ